MVRWFPSPLQLPYLSQCQRQTSLPSRQRMLRRCLMRPLAKRPQPRRPQQQPMLRRPQPRPRQQRQQRPRRAQQQRPLLTQLRPWQPMPLEPERLH